MALCSTGTVAQWAGRNVYNPLEVSSIPSVFMFFVFLKGMPPPFVFLSDLLGTESQTSVASCSAGTVAQWSSMNVL